MPFAIVSPSAVSVSGNPKRAVADAVGAALVDPTVTRLIVDAAECRDNPDAHLARVIAALMLGERLDVEVAFVATAPTVATAIYGLPHGPAGRELAEHGHAEALPLMRDDAATVLVGRARHLGADGDLHGEGYVDDHRLFDGDVPGVVIEPTPNAPGLRARLDRSRLLRRDRWYPGRAVQTGGTNLVVERDGERADRAVKRSTFYRHHVDFRLVRP